MTEAPHETADAAADAQPHLPARWDTDYYDPDRVAGVVRFAAVVVALAGVLNVLHGIAALDDARVFDRRADFAVGSLHTWGIALLITGLLQIAAAPGIWRRVEWARWVGVVTAAGNTVVQLLFLPAYPVVSIALFLLDLLVIYALVAEGGRGTSSI
jgi:uncharacterized membrane protein (DUF2068 family)